MNIKKMAKAYVDNQLFCIKATVLLAKSTIKGLK